MTVLSSLQIAVDMFWLYVNFSFTLTFRNYPNFVNCRVIFTGYDFPTCDK